MTPDILIVGHIVKDLVGDGWRPGGPALFSSVQAQRLGAQVATVTSCSQDIAPSQIAPEVDWHIVASDEGLTFENSYRDGVRIQRVHGSTSVLALNQVPDAWRKAPLILLAPVFHDVDPALASQLAGTGTMLACTAQGWLRQRQPSRVLAHQWPAQPAWLSSDAVFLSEEDVADPDSVPVWSHLLRYVVLTRSDEGCSLWAEGTRLDIPALPAEEVDPTGAGDVFAAAFVCELRRAGDAYRAATFAAAAASLSVEAVGLHGIGDRPQIEERQARGPVP